RRPCPAGPRPRAVSLRGRRRGLPQAWRGCCASAPWPRALPRVFPAPLSPPASGSLNRLPGARWANHTRRMGWWSWGCARIPPLKHPANPLSEAKPSSFCYGTAHHFATLVAALPGLSHAWIGLENLFVDFNRRLAVAPGGTGAPLGQLGGDLLQAFLELHHLV